MQLECIPNERDVTMISKIKAITVCISNLELTVGTRCVHHLLNSNCDTSWDTCNVIVGLCHKRGLLAIISSNKRLYMSVNKK